MGFAAAAARVRDPFRHAEAHGVVPVRLARYGLPVRRELEDHRQACMESPPTRPGEQSRRVVCLRVYRADESTRRHGSILWVPDSAQHRLGKPFVPGVERIAAIRAGTKT